MAASNETVKQVVEQIRRWQKKHRLMDGEVDELFRWIKKVEGNQSFNETIQRIRKEYLGPNVGGWDEY
jgi:uncharacterized membrane-anchored protein YjiN (DUF445 family)